jgi:hypothetical protein
VAAALIRPRLIVEGTKIAIDPALPEPLILPGRRVIADIPVGTGCRLNAGGPDQFASVIPRRVVIRVVVTPVEIVVMRCGLLMLIPSGIPIMAAVMVAILE